MRLHFALIWFNIYSLNSKNVSIIVSPLLNFFFKVNVHLAWPVDVFVREQTPALLMGIKFLTFSAS